MQLLSRLFGRKDEVPAEPGTAVNWAPIIWGYAQSFWRGGWSLKNSDRARKECNDRGLAFGKVRVVEADYGRVKIGLLGEQKVTTEQSRRALEQAISEAGLSGRLEFKDGFSGGTDVVFTDVNDPMPGQHVSGFQDGQSSNWKEFCSVDCWSSGGLREMEAPSQDALRVLVRTADILGFEAGPKHYAHESDVKVENIVQYALRWEDPKTKAHYLEVLYRPELVKHWVRHGGNCWDERTEGALKGEVLAATGVQWWPKMTINNRPVYSTIINEPTEAMLRARAKAAEQTASTCGVPDCGKPSEWDVFVARFVMGDFAGESSHGSIHHACADPAHLELQKTSNGGVKVSVNPAYKQVWL